MSGIPKNVPLVWIAIAVTTGIVVDRTLAVPFLFAKALGGASLVSFLIARSRSHVAPTFLLLAAAASGSAYHRIRQESLASANLTDLATIDGTPVQLRGRLVSNVQRMPGSVDDPLQSIPRPGASKLLIDVTSLSGHGGEEAAWGRVVAFANGTIADPFPGDEIIVRGRLALPRGPSNPGEFDSSRELRDQGIVAVLSLPPAGDAVRLVAHRWPASIWGWLGRAHTACLAILDEHLTVEPALAAALLLGDGSGLSRPEWDKFLKSGVVHALAISGQHLVVLAAFLVVIRRVLWIRLTPATLGIAMLLIGYALFTGGRAPAMRAAWMVLVLSLAVMVRRPPAPANTLALAWLGVVLVNPADIFQTGCQLSFLAVAMLEWLVNPWVRNPWIREPNELDRLAAATGLTRVHRWTWMTLKGFGMTYAASALVWLGVTPLVAERYHVISPIALLIGPPVMLATSIALVAGFLLLLTAPILGPIAAPFAWLTDGSLWLCETIIDWGLRIPGASFTIGTLPPLWLAVFYVGLLAILVRPQWRSRWLVPLAATWMLFGAALGLGFFRTSEFRIAFLSVGHGGCTVIETDAGRVLVYDAGAMTGPDVTRRVIVPYLLSRNIRRIDDLFISHADLDHFNGVADLLSRVSVQRVTLTPSFIDRGTPGTRRTLFELERRGIPTRVVQAGHDETIDGLKIDVLHPPANGPEGKENARSLVMLIRKGALRTLLTGDLEEAGLDQVMNLRPPAIDIFMAPHHGSRLANTVELANWAQPRVVISNQGRPRGVTSPAAVYEAVGARYLTTYHDGAIEITMHGGTARIQAFRTKEAILLTPRIR